MGDVYQATDSKLGRSVAIKLLPEAFARDTDRVARFEREARVLASLNHPNIAAIHGFEDSGGRKFLVMELVDGETLAERIKRGPIPVEEALWIAKQTCEALESAHEKGVIHRDLKPANIKITPDGKVKVLDFGLAKAYEANPSNASLSNSPTMASMGATNAGVILGTAAYMSPEQAKGRTVDKRTDIFAFGCVLYEMLTGQRAFDGEDLTEILSRVLQREPDWTKLPASVPSRVRELLRLCLEKNVRNRRSDAADVRLDIEQALNEPANATLPPPTRLSWTTALSIFTTIALATFLFYERRFAGTQEAEAIRFSISTPEKAAFESVSGAALAGSISPDGRRLAFTAKDAAGKTLVWIRPLDALIPQPLTGTEDGDMPFWSPDSRWVGFFAHGKLKKVDVAGGPPLILCDAPDGRGGTWNREDTILFAPSYLSGLHRVNSAGGEPTVVGPRQTLSRFPFFLPDGNHFVFFMQGSTDSGGIYIGALDSSDSQRLVAADGAAIYALPGYLLFVRQGTLLAQPFDSVKLKTTGDPVRIADSVPSDLYSSPFSVSETGVLAYRTGPVSQDLQLAWYDRSGKLLETVGLPGRYVGVDLSPDGKRLAAHRHDGDGGDLWVFEPRGDMWRLTFNPTQDNSMPIWSPDGTRIVFGSFRNEKWGIYQKASNGTGAEELLVESVQPKVPMAWSPDGKSIVYNVIDPKTNADQWLLPLTGYRKPVALLNTPFAEAHTQISPNGKWMAYRSNREGKFEVYVKPFPVGEGGWQVSTGGAHFPRWRADGKEIFYFTQTGGGRVMAASVNGDGETFDVVGVPKELFDSGYVHHNHAGSLYYHTFAVSPDGQRFLIPRPASNLQGASEAAPITIVLNWTAMLKKQ